MAAPTLTERHVHDIQQHKEARGMQDALKTRAGGDAVCREELLRHRSGGLRAREGRKTPPNPPFTAHLASSLVVVVVVVRGALVRIHWQRLHTPPHSPCSVAPHSFIPPHRHHLPLHHSPSLSHTTVHAGHCIALSPRGPCATRYAAAAVAAASGVAARNIDTRHRLFLIALSSCAHPRHCCCTSPCDTPNPSRYLLSRPSPCPPCHSRGHLVSDRCLPVFPRSQARARTARLHRRRRLVLEPPCALVRV